MKAWNIQAVLNNQFNSYSYLICFITCSPAETLCLLRLTTVSHEMDPVSIIRKSLDYLALMSGNLIKTRLPSKQNKIILSWRLSQSVLSSSKQEQAN